MDGTPAKYQQKPSVDKNIIYANASKIEYMEQQNLITLLGKANITQDNNTFTGDKISYNTAKRTIVANANDNNVKAKGRVNVILNPNKK
jgi:lipopolysaccharide export system protein LptA